MKKGFSKDNILMWESFMGNHPTTMDEFEVTETPYDDLDGVDDGSMTVMEFEPMDQIDAEADTTLDLAVYSDIKKLAEYSKRILEICKTQEIEPWMQAQLVKASSFVSDVWHQLDAKIDFANMGFEHSDNQEL